MSKKKIGIIAGSGKLPHLIDEYCINNDIYCCFAFIDTAPQYQINSSYITTTVGQVGKILNFFKENNITDIILAGGLRKPNFQKIKLDFKGGILLGKILKNKLLGDNSLLTTIISYLESYHYNIIAVDELLPDIHLNLGHNNSAKPSYDISNDIALGLNILNALESLDVGQATIVQNGRVIAIEAAEGTDNMMLRSKEYIEESSKSPAILIKLKKISQDRRVDLPTIGIKTIDNAIKNNIKGIVLDYANTIIIEKNKLLEYAAENGIFIYGTENKIS